MWPLGLAISAALLAVVEANDPCCQGNCTVSGEEKFWSISKGLDGTRHCGESCMSPSKYHLYHTFEWNLIRANNTNTPCKDFGFTKYDSTSTHGFGPIKMTLDSYDQPLPSDNHCCEGKCKASGEYKYWSLTKGEDGTLLCGETCLTSSKEVLVHMVEWNLTWANGTDSPCNRSGYSTYYKTVTHSFGVTSVTSDLYSPPPPSPAYRFERGVMAALGYDDGAECFQESRGVAEDLLAIGQKLRKGDTIARARALEELAAKAKQIVETLEHCSSATTDAEKYAELVKNLKDPRFYTLHNALTLALNLADDRKMLENFIVDLEKREDYDAGKELILIVLDVIGRPGIPLESNSSAGVQIAAGIAIGFGEKINITCFQDARVEIPLVIGGVLECLTGVGMIRGFESLFHGIEGIVPMFKHCLDDRHKIMSILKGFGDFKDPHGLARLVEQNMIKNGIDISLGVAHAVLAAKGQQWYSLGQSVGKILEDIALNNTLTTFEFVV